MTAEKEKTAVGKFLQNIGIPILKGGIKSIPFVGNIAVDIIENITKKDLATGTPKSHNQFVLIIEVIGALTLAYLVIKGIIPIDQLLEYIKGVV